MPQTVSRCQPLFSQKAETVFFFPKPLGMLFGIHHFKPRKPFFANHGSKTKRRTATDSDNYINSKTAMFESEKPYSFAAIHRRNRA
jgi:hypothetical protein